MSDKDEPNTGTEAETPEADQATDEPSTWENVVVGEVKEALGRIFHNEELAESGKEQVETAHEVREEYREEHEHHKD
jgi:uncharacterized protein YjbJ (UPF0337 family)